jgi:hypothetical protein
MGGFLGRNQRITMLSEIDAIAKVFLRTGSSDDNALKYPMPSTAHQNKTVGFLGL